MAPDDVAVDLGRLAVLAHGDVDERFDGGRVDRSPGAQHEQQLAHHAGGLFHAGVVAGEPQLVAAQRHLAAQLAFEDLEIGVVLARQGEGLGVVAELDRLARHGFLEAAPVDSGAAFISRPAGCAPAG